MPKVEGCEPECLNLKAERRLRRLVKGYKFRSAPCLAQAGMYRALCILEVLLLYPFCIHFVFFLIYFIIVEPLLFVKGSKASLG